MCARSPIHTSALSNSLYRMLQMQSPLSDPLNIVVFFFCCFFLDDILSLWILNSFLTLLVQCTTHICLFHMSKIFLGYRCLFVYLYICGEYSPLLKSSFSFQSNQVLWEYKESDWVSKKKKKKKNLFQKLKDKVAIFLWQKTRISQFSPFLEQIKSRTLSTQ